MNALLFLILFKPTADVDSVSWSFPAKFTEEYVYYHAGKVVKKISTTYQGYLVMMKDGRVIKTTNKNYARKTSILFD